MPNSHNALTIEQIDSELDEIGRQLGSSQPRKLTERYKIISNPDVPYIGERFDKCNFLDEDYGAAWITFCRRKYDGKKK